MIFEQTRSAIASQNRTAQRRADVKELIGVFKSAFPTLDFRILEKVTAVNAQASILNGVRSVDLFGGFSYHPRIFHDAMVFVLLHEAGHHLSRGCRLPWMSKLACDCSADNWALTEGQVQINKQDCRFDLEKALDQIEMATKPISQSFSTKGSSRCAFLNWNERKRRLLESELNNRSICAIV